MSNTVFVLVAVVIIIVIVAAISRKPAKDFTNTPNGDVDKKATEAVRINDKLIRIEKVTYDQLKRVLYDFKALYIDEFTAAGLVSISDTSYIIRFPEGISFRLFAYLVNYLHYPNDIESWNPNIIAWTTLQQGDEWVNEEMLNKKAMLFIPDDDTEYDNVHLITDYAKGYILDFSKTKAKVLNNPAKGYSAPDVGAENTNTNIDVIK